MKLITFEIQKHSLTFLAVSTFNSLTRMHETDYFLFLASFMIVQKVMN